MILGRKSIAVRLLLLLAVAALSGIVYFVFAPGCPSGCAVERDEVRQVEPPRDEVVTLRTVTGQDLTLPEIAAGQKVAIVVMKGMWCTVCTSQIERLQLLEAELDGLVVGVTDQPAELNAREATRLGLTLPILSDTDGDFLQDVGLSGCKHPTPGIVFLDERGEVVEVVRGRYPSQPQEAMIAAHFGQ